MLERVFINSAQFSLGALAEALVYYGHVDVELGANQIADIIQDVGLSGLMRLAESDLITIEYSPFTYGLSNEYENIYPHRLWTIHLADPGGRKKIRPAEDELGEFIARRIGRNKIFRKQIKRIFELNHIRTPLSPHLSKVFLNDLADRQFLEAAVKLHLRNSAPEYPDIDNISVNIEVGNDSFFIDSNIDMAIVGNMIAKQRNTEYSEIHPSWLVTPILSMRSNISQTGDRRSDLWYDDFQSRLMNLRVDLFLKKIDTSKQRIHRFNESKFFGRSFSESVNLGDISIMDILDFSESKETRKFKEWTSGLSANRDLILEYEKSRISQSKILQSFPFKTVRFVTLAGAGAALDNFVGGSGAIGAAGGIAGNVVLSFAEEMLLSSLKLGWKPQHWVNDAALPLLSNNKS
jgi:hypothetical protein